MTNRLYTTIPAPKLPRNTFDRSHPNTLSMVFQRCTPTWLEEIVPGDLYRVGQETFCRLQPLIAPVMNNMRLSQHFFYVPLRTLNKHVSEFLFNNRRGNYTDVLPYVYTDTLYELVDDLKSNTSLCVEMIRLFDFIGLPFSYSSATTAFDLVNNWLNDTYNIKVSASHKRVNIAPFLAYTKIWSEYFRDENIVEDPFVEFEDDTQLDVQDWTGDVSSYFAVATFGYECAVSFLRLRPRSWQHDRFTSCLPFPQRGPDVLLPVSGQVDVTYKDGFLLGDVTPPRTGKFVFSGGNPAVETKYEVGKSTGASTVTAVGTGNLASKSSGAYDPNGSLEVDFDNAQLSTTINEFRRAERVERWFENSARGGTRPNEATLAHFGVITPDATLDRAQFLGGNMQPIVVSEVTQNSQTTSGEDGSPLGTLAGKGTSYKGTRAFRAYFTEFGFVFCFTSALVRANYWQGIPKVFSRMTRDEYYWPEFANLGEEPVYTKELYVDQNVAEDDVFGYVPRYSDYKSTVGEVHGDMRTSLSFWTQTREFANKPALSEEFLYGQPDLSPFAVSSPFTDLLIVTINFNVSASRLMPFYGVPTI